MSQDDYQDYEYLDDAGFYQSDKENIDSDIDSSQFYVQEFEEILILEVQERPCLWDQRLDIKMRGINAIRKAWEEVGKVLNVDPKVCQKKWKNLRDTYLRKYRDEKSYIASGSAATNKVINWKYYKQMQFLKHTVGHRRTFSNIQMVEDEESSGFYPRKNTDEVDIKQSSKMPDRTSPSLLRTMKDENEYSILSSPSIRKTMQHDSFIPPSTSPPNRSSTPLSSSSCGSQKRKKSEENVNITSTVQKVYKENSDKLEDFIMGQVTQSTNETATFCNFVKTRLEKLDRRYYLRATHNIMNELIKLETKAEDETSGK